MRFSFNITAAQQSFELDRSFEFTRFRLTHAYINNVSMGNTSGCLYFNVNNLTENVHLHTGSRAKQPYSFKLLSIEGGAIGFDRTLNSWDYDNSYDKKVVRQIDITVSEDTTLNFAGSTIILEIDFQ